LQKGSFFEEHENFHLFYVYIIEEAVAEKPSVAIFLSRVSILTRDIDIANLSVRPLRSGIRWKQLNISSQFFHHTVAQSF